MLDRLVADEDLVDTMEYIEAFKNTDISGYISAISEERPDLLIKNLNYLTKSQMHLVDTPSLVYTLFEKGEYDALAEGAQWIHDPELYQSIPTCLVTE
ncbi:MAG: hypothetical protein U9Q15_03805 [Patescibacteria group bacterium]|nr:hypothetical protein [Patescibacteria group bacterium]